MFLAPAFLFGLLAIAVPLWLHRVARADPSHHPFASLMLLEASETQRTAKLTLRYWLLLATRILLLVALALAFAGPLVTDEIVPNAGADAKLHAIVLDDSLSMQHGERWQRALDAAQGILDDLPGSDRVMLVAASGRRIAVVHDAVPAANAGALRARLRTLKPGIERLDYGLAMSTAGNWLGSPRPQAVLHMISDLQQSAAPIRFADLEPPPRAQLVIHDVGGGAAENVFVAAAALTTLDTRSLEVVLHSTAAQPQRREITLSIDGREYARREVEIPAAPAPAAMLLGEGGSARGATESAASAATASRVELAFADLKLSPGTHRIEVALEPRDSLAQDDRFFAVLEHADPKALLITPDRQADDTAYFGAAIGSLSAPALRIEHRHPDAITAGGLAGYSLLVVADTAALPETQAARIRDYVAAGGSVLATLGAGQSATPPTALLEGWRIGESRPVAAKVGEIETTHPVLREAADWHHVRFFRQRQVEIAAGDQVLIAQEDGSPLLVEHPIGAGRMLVLSAPIDRNWSDLAIHPLFVRFIAESARYLVGAGASAVSSTVGSVVTTGLTAVGGGQIFDPRGERVLGLAQTTAAERLIPDQAGFYEIRGSEAVRWLAVNVDARESDLSVLPPVFIERWQALHRREAGANVAAPATSNVVPRSLGPAALWLAAALVLAELLLANRYLAVRREIAK